MWQKEQILGSYWVLGPPTPSLLGQPGQNFHPHFSQEEIEVLREEIYPVARQLSGSAEIAPSSDLEGPHYTLSLRGTPSPPIKSLVIVSTYCRPDPVPRGGHVCPSLESRRRPGTEEAMGGGLWEPRGHQLPRAAPKCLQRQ